MMNCTLPHYDFFFAIFAMEKKEKEQKTKCPIVILFCATENLIICKKSDIDLA